MNQPINLRSVIKRVLRFSFFICNYLFYRFTILKLNVGSFKRLAYKLGKTKYQFPRQFGKTPNYAFFISVITEIVQNYVSTYLFSNYKVMTTRILFKTFEKMCFTESPFTMESGKSELNSQQCIIGFVCLFKCLKKSTPFNIKEIPKYE